MGKAFRTTLLILGVLCFVAVANGNDKKLETAKLVCFALGLMSIAPFIGGFVFTMAPSPHVTKKSAGEWLGTGFGVLTVCVPLYWFGWLR
ncbi:hypothetical protein K8Q98_03080 [Candidatus Nomurabacteria bacterium]|nr:hypothetical protein [Candidatus Nomurabacteria bacterium]